MENMHDVCMKIDGLWEMYYIFKSFMNLEWEPPIA